MKIRCRNGEYSTQTDAESAFRQFVEGESTCQKAKSASSILHGDLQVGT